MLPRASMLDETSIDRQLQREARFEPPFCPNSQCPIHEPKAVRTKFWREHGSVKLKRFPYASRRIQCKVCGATFSPSIFQIHYRQKVWGLNAEIFGFFRASGGRTV